MIDGPPRQALQNHSSFGPLTVRHSRARKGVRTIPSANRKLGGKMAKNQVDQLCQLAWAEWYACSRLTKHYCLRGRTIQAHHNSCLRPWAFERISSPAEVPDSGELGQLESISLATHIRPKCQLNINFTCILVFVHKGKPF